MAEHHLLEKKYPCWFVQIFQHIPETSFNLILFILNFQLLQNLREKTEMGQSLYPFHI